MPINKQDWAVSLLFALGFSTATAAVYRLRRKAIARFLLFHDILPGTESRFESHLRWLKKKTQVISLDDFFSDRLSSRRLNVVLTFDDGYRSWIDCAVPLLRRLSLPASFFISSGFLGLSKKEENDYLRSNLFVKLGPRKTTGALGVDDVRAIASSGFSIGGHTVNHRILSEIRDQNHLKYEISIDKRRLEEITGREIKYFAFPSGAFSHRDIDIVKILKETGYAAAVCTTVGFNCLESNPFRLHREIVEADMSDWVFRARVRGNVDAIMSIKKHIPRKV